MTFSRVISHAKSFGLQASALNAPKISLPLSDHNMPLIGDELSTLALNYQWRRVLVHLASEMLDRRIYDGTEAEIDTVVQQVHVLLSDMYDLGGTGVDYLGARVARTAILTVTPAGFSVPFDDDTSFSLHDVGGFWNVASPTFLAVPVGGDGFYYCYARLRWLAGGVQVHAIMQASGGGNIAFATTLDNSITSLVLSATINRAAGSNISLRVFSLIANRDVGPGAGTAFAVTFGMYRVGLTP